VFQADPLVCRRCGGPLKVVAYITDALAIQKILDHQAALGAGDIPAAVESLQAFVNEAQASVNGEKLDTSLADEKLIHPAVRVIASLTRGPAAPRGAAGALRGAAGPGVKALMHSHHVAS
jgi:hypothetical protein